YCVHHAPDVTHPNRRTVAHVHDEVAEGRRVRQASGDSDESLGVALHDASGRYILVFALQCGHHVGGRDAVRAHVHGIELDADLSRRGAVQVHAADARDALDAWPDDLIGEVADFAQRTGRAAEGDRHDRRVVRVESLDHGVVDFLGKLAANAGNLDGDLRLHPDRIDAEVEIQANVRRALGGR